MRRLFVQIYLTIIASLVAVVVVTGLFWQFAGRDRMERDGLEIAGTLAAGSLAALEAPAIEQQRAIRQLSKMMKIDIALYDRDFQLIASWGGQLPLPSKTKTQGGRIGGFGPPSWQIRLPDQRWLIAGVTNHRSRGIAGPLVYVAMIALLIAVIAYPLVRRLTGRLERLQQGVKQIGGGDFSARVKVEGKDEIGRLAASFNHAAERIEKLMGAHRQLLAHASHELRTPLSRIRLGIDLIKGRNDDERRRALEQDIGELDELIDEILLMSRLDADTESAPHEELDLLAIVAEECAHYEDSVLAGEPVEISGNLRLLQRLVRNLMINAKRHGKPPIEVQLSCENGRAVLSVLDHGPGIPEAEREKVLAPFYRLPGRQDVKGSGLGLALVNQIAESHGGDVTFFDEPQSGRFGVRVSLPVGAGTA